ncbi:MAG: UvrB/UvrC motif-containing protein [candidate division WOR-3 bacterium]
MKRLCDICGKNEAILTVRHLDKEGKATEIGICAQCAKERGFSGVEDLQKGAAELLAELKARIEDKDKKVVCPKCGMSFAEFKRVGRLGCASCYLTFGKEIEPLIRRLHGSVQHVGKSPQEGVKRAQERLKIQRLRKELEVAIKEEDYERAAALRDLLREAGDEPKN